MKSICIKTNNEKEIDYLLKNLENYKLDNIYYSFKEFKIYKNIIVHYTGTNEKLFLENISNTLSCLVLDLYEQIIIRNLTKSEYFYFEKHEQIQIEEITEDDLYDKEESIYTKKQRLNTITNSFKTYLENNHSIVLNGFIQFRLRKYLDMLLEQIDKSVNRYIIEREYTELISLLKLYVDSEPEKENTVHLIYTNKPILLDENKNIIDVTKDIQNIKYLSDISFSNNDFILNTLLTLIPKKIYIHLTNNYTDEFIDTISLIFDKRITFCNNCDICSIYKKSTMSKK